MVHDALGDRMKEYERVPKLFLTRRCPVIIRLDGRAFHSFTRGLEKPFDRMLMTVMQETMRRLCEQVQGCVFGYTQSDEITLVLTDYKTIKTDAWFGYNVQKMTSISASIATLEFNKIFSDEIYKLYHLAPETFDKNINRVNLLENKRGCATFDSRVFTVPKEEVCNCFVWRQQDATRNSIEAAGQANFPHSKLQGKNCNQIQDMLFKEKGINWNDYPTDFKRGSACYKVKSTETMQNPRRPDETITVERNRWIVDTEIPVFTQDREFVEKWL